MSVSNTNLKEVPLPTPVWEPLVLFFFLKKKKKLKLKLKIITINFDVGGNLDPYTLLF
jgi:hypothetical protein